MQSTAVNSIWSLAVTERPQASESAVLLGKLMLVTLWSFPVKCLLWILSHLQELGLKKCSSISASHLPQRSNFLNFVICQGAYGYPKEKNPTEYYWNWKMKFLKSIKISRFINCICSNSPFSRWGETRMVKKSREMIKGASKAWCTHSLSEIFYNH